MKLIDRIKGKIYGLLTILKFENWLELICVRVLTPRRTLLVHKVGGMELVVDYAAQEQNGTSFCVARLAYADLLERMSFPNPSINVVDAGANGGGFCPMLLLLGYSINKVLAVEMNPQTYSRMYLNTVRNVDADCHLVMGALCGKNGSTKVSLGCGSVADSLDSGIVQEHAREVDVQLYDFDTLIGAHYGESEEIDICKLDIEGAEFEMFFEGSCARLDDCRYLIIELHPNTKYTEDDVFRFLDDRGFDLSKYRSAYEETVYMFVNRLKIH